MRSGRFARLRRVLADDDGLDHRKDQVARHADAACMLADRFRVSRLIDADCAEASVGLLHDIGKAVSHEVNGSHAVISAQLARRCGETEGVVHAIEAHHYEVQPQTVESVLLIAADAISASRPGARGESLENYIRRLEALEEIATAKAGVAKAYALQAGREIRVIVEPTEVDDFALPQLAVAIAKHIEADLTYPGEIKVTVVRELRASATAG